MARKAIVDRNIVLQLLKEGKTSQSIAAQFGVSRQAIDLHRKEFIRTGLLPGSGAPLPVATLAPLLVTTPVPPISASTVPSKPLSHSIARDSNVGAGYCHWLPHTHSPQNEARHCG